MKKPVKPVKPVEVWALAYNGRIILPAMFWTREQARGYNREAMLTYDGPIRVEIRPVQSKRKP